MILYLRTCTRQKFDHNIYMKSLQKIKTPSMKHSYPSQEMEALELNRDNGDLYQTNIFLLLSVFFFLKSNLE